MQSASGSIEWGMVSAIASAIAVIVALYAHSRNLAHTRLSNSAKMVLDLLNTFNTAEMRLHRSNFAKTFLTNPASFDLLRDAPVLEFFEEIGYMTRRGVLDKGMVWNSFFWSLEPYYLAVTRSSNAIKLAREEAGTNSLYREVEWLYKKLCKMHLKEDKRQVYIEPSESYLKKYFEDESQLILSLEKKPFTRRSSK